MAATTKMAVLWDAAYCLHHQGILMMKAANTPETSVNF
jgi:hypothetical protein